jgi:hypothetical protein
MSLENSIKDCITKELEKGIIEKVLAEKLEECIASSVKDMFGWSGDVKKVIEEKIKSVMIPYLERYDYSQYIVKLDSVLVDVLKNTSLENKKLLTNFEELMVAEDKKEKITVTELFEKWKKYVSENVDTDDLEVDYDDSPSYEYVEVTLDFEEDECRSWSNLESGTLIFECEHDEKMNFGVKLHRWKDSKDKTWSIDYKTNREISSLRYINEFEVYLMKLHQADIKIQMDTTSESDEVQPEKEPEASWS